MKKEINAIAFDSIRNGWTGFPMPEEPKWNFYNGPESEDFKAHVISWEQATKNLIRTSPLFENQGEISKRSYRKAPYDILGPLPDTPYLLSSPLMVEEVGQIKRFDGSWRDAMLGFESGEVSDTRTVLRIVSEEKKEAWSDAPGKEYYVLNQLRIKYGQECFDPHTGRPLTALTFDEWLKTQK